MANTGGQEPDSVSDALIFGIKIWSCINGGKNKQEERRARRVIVGIETSRGRMRFAVPLRALIYPRPSGKSESSYLQASLVILHR